MKNLDNAAAEKVLLRRDAVTILKYLHAHRVTGTQSTGNLPLQAIREINAQLTPPMQLDERIGKKVYHLRSEEQVWRIYFPHILADVAGLVKGGRARRFRFTPSGEHFLDSDAADQVWILFDTWWHRVNWMIAFPVAGLGDALPLGFSSKVLNLLRRLPQSKNIEFDNFADQVIETTGLRWTSADPTFHRLSLHASVERMVVNVLASFSVVETQYRRKRLGKGTIKDLSAFRITPFGHALLNSLD